MMKKRIVVIAVALVALLISTAALADDTNVTYDGTAQKFVFIPESTDLFAYFKGVMPGDSIEQRIHISNSIGNEVKIKLYLKAEPVDPEHKDFLNQMTLSVVQDGNSILFSGPAGEQGNLADFVYLGTFYSGAETDLIATLEMPIETGNEYMDKFGQINWVFAVEELPIEPDDPTPPITGDRQITYIVISVMAAAALLVTVKLIVDVRKKKAKKS